jgi:hypothetical protein
MHIIVFSLNPFSLSLKNTEQGWKCGSSGRAPASQVQGPEFKLQRHTHTHTHTLSLSLTHTHTNSGEEPDMVAHVYNSSYLGGRGRRIVVQG